MKLKSSREVIQKLQIYVKDKIIHFSFRYINPTFPQGFHIILFL